KAKVTEAKGETGAARHMAQHHPEYEMASGFAPGSGYDQVYVRRDSSGKVTEYMIVEAKGAGAGLSTDAKKGPQMSQQWVKNSADEMAKTGNPTAKEKKKGIKNGPPAGGRGKVNQTQPDGSTREVPCPNGGVYN